MGKLGPLTSQALGRSPYEDVVQGTGEEDPHEPKREYDEKGRIVNPETRTVIKDIIRAHNEVMQVIGVAELESSTAEADIALAKEHQQYESETGLWLLRIGRTAGILGQWGIQGFRQRLLVFKPYSHIEFIKLLEFESRQRSLKNLAFAGLPSFLAAHGLKLACSRIKMISQNRWLGSVLSVVRLHFQVWLTLQRLDLIPATKWFPSIDFFIPFTSASPIAAPPPIEVWNLQSVSGWVHVLAVNMAPYAAYYLCGRLWSITHRRVWPLIISLLPHPTAMNSPQRAKTIERPPIPVEEQWTTIPESPTLGAADREIRHSRAPDQDIPTLQALEGQASMSGPAIPIVPVRRQSTFSSRGGDQDYGTDDEDAEILNPTLISFDVDTSDSNEQPPGGWSAELRPSYASDGRLMPKEPRIYIVNALTTLPAALAADVLSTFVAYILCAPYEAFTLQWMATAFANRRGIPIEGMIYDSLFQMLTWRGVGNMVGIEVARLLVSGEIWAVTAILSQWLHVTEEEWKEIHKEEEAEKAAQASEAAQGVEGGPDGYSEDAMLAMEPTDP